MNAEELAILTSERDDRISDLCKAVYSYRKANKAYLCAGIGEEGQLRLNAMRRRKEIEKSALSLADAEKSRIESLIDDV